jgi:hypothetical protein
MGRTFLNHRVNTINAGLRAMVIRRNHRVSVPLPATRSFQTAGYWLGGGGAGTWFVDGEFVAELTASGTEGAVVAESFTGERAAVCGVDGGEEAGSSSCAHPQSTTHASTETIAFRDDFIMRLLSCGTANRDVEDEKAQSACIPILR